MSKQELKKQIEPILKKGKIINDIIFFSKKITKLDVAFMLILLRPTRDQVSMKYRITHNDHNDYGWTDKQIYDMVDNPVLTGGKDGLDQLLFGCISALEVYTEDEIMKVFEIQKQYHREPNE